MISNVGSFYINSLILLIFALGVIFSPRLYWALICMFGCFVFSSLLLFNLSAIFVVMLDILFSLCLFLCIFIFAKKIDKLNLLNKIVFPFKLFVRFFFLILFGVLIFSFFYEEQSRSIFNVFNIVLDKTIDVVNFTQYLFPLHLIVLLVFVCIVVSSVFFKLAQSNISDLDNKDTEDEELS